MCGLPLLYLKKCGHNLTPRFLALGKPCIYISIYLSIYLSVTKAIAGLQIRALLKLLGCLYNNWFDCMNFHYLTRHEVLHKNIGLTFVEVQK